MLTTLDLLNHWPGGVSALAKQLGVHPKTLYTFSRAAKRKQFPTQLAVSIATVFEGVSVYGKEVTVDRLRAMWDKTKSEREGAKCG